MHNLTLLTWHLTINQSINQNLLITRAASSTELKSEARSSNLRQDLRFLIPDDLLFGTQGLIGDLSIIVTHSA